MPDHAISTDPAVQAQLDRLEKLSPGRDVLGLERISALMARLGNPHRKLPPVLHVAGTNGKGSTCAFLRAGIEAAGLTAHVYTSPHLIRFNERIRVAGTLIPDAELALLLSEVLDCSTDISPSFFEATTAAAFLAFSRSRADAAIIEVGLGGRLDATNVIETPAVCGIAQLGVDHEAFLLDPTNGPDWPALERIGWEKAGIAKAGASLITMDYPALISRRIAQQAALVGANWLPRKGDWDSVVYNGQLHYRDMAGKLSLPLPRLPGGHQAENAALAIAMLRHQTALDVPESALKAAMGWAQWPARLQRLEDGPLTQGREVWLDGAHNEAAGASVAAFVKGLGKPVHLVTGILANKDARGLLGHFQGICDRLTAIPVPGHPCHEPEALAEVARSLGMEADTADGPAEAVANCTTPVTFFLVSLYLSGQVLVANGQVID